MDEAAYTLESVQSADGTRIGYRRFGAGPGVILIHGGMQASQNFGRLARALSDRFSVYVPDRRGRGASGPYGDDYGLHKERDDIAALLEKTGARRVFGLSSGAVITLFAALSLPTIERVALYEPPLPFEDSLFDWVSRYEHELARADLAAAMVTVIRATADPSVIDTLPRFVLEPLLRLAMHIDAKRVVQDQVPLRMLVPTIKYDVQLVAAMQSRLDAIPTLRAATLLLGGDQSRKYLRTALDTLAKRLPSAARLELRGTGHLAADDQGKPDLVAVALRDFFAAS